MDGPLLYACLLHKLESNALAFGDDLPKLQLHSFIDQKFKVVGNPIEKAE